MFELTRISRYYVLTVSGVFTLYGLLFIVFPVQMLQGIVEFLPTSSSAIIDLRATYGGMSTAVGIILFLLARQSITLKVGLLSVALLMGGMATGRAVGIAIDGGANSTMLLYCALEVIALAVALVLHRLLEKRS